EGEPRDSRRRALRDDLQAFDDAWHDLVLQAGIQIFRVLADDDQVDVLEAGLHAGKVLDRPQVRIQIQRLPEPDVDAAEPFRDRRRHRSLQRHLVPFDRIEQRGWQRVADLLEGDDAGVVALPGDVNAGVREDVADRLGDFGSDAVAWNERDRVSHQSSDM